MEHSPSWEADSRSAGQEIARILLGPQVHDSIHKSQPLDRTLIQFICCFHRAGI
jgi:hypothetical protein